MGNKSVVRTDWLLIMVETMIKEAVGAATFRARRWLCESVIALIVA